MIVKVLGTGCASCAALYETVKQAVSELGLQALVINEQSLINIIGYNVMTFPALVVDEEIVSEGREISLSEVKEFLQRYIVV